MGFSEMSEGMGVASFGQTMSLCPLTQLIGFWYTASIFRDKSMGHSVLLKGFVGRIQSIPCLQSKTIEGEMV